MSNKSTEPETKESIIETRRLHDKDSGSSPVQIALLTARINHLVEHLRKHKKDHSARRGLLILVGLRSKLIKYYYSKDPEAMRKLATSLKIKLKVA